MPEYAITILLTQEINDIITADSEDSAIFRALNGCEDALACGAIANVLKITKLEHEEEA